MRGEAITVPVAFYRCTECSAEHRDSGDPHDPLDRAYRTLLKRLVG